MRMRVQIGLPPFDHTLRLTRLPEITLTINFWTWTCSIFVHGCLAMTLEDIYYVFFIKDLRTIISLVFSRFYLIKHKWTLILYMRNIYNFSMPCWTVNVFSSVMYSLKKLTVSLFSLLYLQLRQAWIVLYRWMAQQPTNDVERVEPVFLCCDF